MSILTTVPGGVWDAKKFKWKAFLFGVFDELKGCPNWLYEEIRPLLNSGSRDMTIIEHFQELYAVEVTGNLIRIYTKKKGK